MGKPTREVVMELLFIQRRLEEVIEDKSDGEAMTAINLALDFIKKALVVWAKKMEAETQKSEK